MRTLGWMLTWSMTMVLGCTTRPGATRAWLLTNDASLKPSACTCATLSARAWLMPDTPMATKRATLSRSAVRASSS